MYIRSLRWRSRVPSSTKQGIGSHGEAEPRNIELGLRVRF